MWFIGGYILGVFSSVVLLSLCRAAGEYDEAMGYKDISQDTKSLNSKE